MRRRYEYYVLHKPTIDDYEFDCMERYFRGLFPDSPILHAVGSDNPRTYPAYIIDGRRPLRDERRYSDGSW
jgi:NAD-dependent DNA ligase